MNHNAIALLHERLKNDMLLFEYGSGYSTLFFAARVAQVISVEHEPKIANKLEVSLPSNVELLYRPVRDIDAYCQAILESGERYDLVVIDGRERVRCAELASSALSQRGVILLDDSQRGEYLPAIQHLQALGFKRLDFNGHQPYGAEGERTSIFYRPENCLEI